MRATDQDALDLQAANDVFNHECDAFRFHYTCPSCAHVAPSANTCSLGYPNEHLKHGKQAITADGNLIFCKYFELSESPADLTGEGADDR